MNNIKTYLMETYQEMVHKVSWPSWNELQNSAVLVLVASLLISLSIFVMDYIFGINGSPSEDVFFRGVLGYYYGFFN